MHYGRPMGWISSVTSMTMALVAVAAWTANLQVLAATSSNVLQLTANTFFSAIHENSLIMVQLYVPWCKFCQALAPEYEIAATRLKMLSSEAVLAKVDCVAEDSLCDDLGVQSYPTLTIYRDGVPQLYSDELKAGAIVSLLQA